MGKRGRKSASKTAKQTYTFPLIMFNDEDGYFVSCPTLQGCYTQGDTYEEAMENIADALKLHIEDRIANNEPMPT